MSQIRLLFDLQELDMAINTRIAEIQELEGRLGETEILRRARAELEEKRTLLQEEQKAQRVLEQEIEDLQEKMKPLSQKLFGGGVRNPKELTNLKAEYDQYKSQVSSREDAVLEKMLAADTRRQEIGSKSKELEQLEEAREQELTQIHSRLQDLKSGLSETEQERQALVDGMDPASYKLYSSLKVNKPRPVARIERGLCQGCRVTLPMDLIRRARAGTAPVFCCNCERVLFIE